MELPRLDILLYAHDGRGLGHASRTIAIGMALRRRYPGLRLLFVSGCKVSQELIGPVPLDWLKLPSYETEVVAGKSRGSAGNTNYSDLELGDVRGVQLAQIVSLYRPRLVLADHTPQGKHRELLPALAAADDTDTRWILGIRGVMGTVSQAGSPLARQIFSSHYQGILWYGDKAVLGSGHQAELQTQYGVQPLECGYVSRLRELQQWPTVAPGGNVSWAGTISVPWLGEHSFSFLTTLAGALARVGPEHGTWRLFIDAGTRAEAQSQLLTLFSPLGHCRLEPLAGRGYIEALGASRSAVIFGGYNSIMDVLALNLPAVVVLRAMQDNEQQQHLAKLRCAAGELLQVVEEGQVASDRIADLLLANLQRTRPPVHTVNLDGAANAADCLWRLLSEGESATS